MNWFNDVSVNLGQNNNGLKTILPSSGKKVFILKQEPGILNVNQWPPQKGGNEQSKPCKIASRVLSQSKDCLFRYRYTHHKHKMLMRPYKIIPRDHYSIKIFSIFISRQPPYFIFFINFSWHSPRIWKEFSWVASGLFSLCIGFICPTQV